MTISPQWSRLIEGLFYTLTSPLLLCGLQHGRNSLSTSQKSDEEIKELAASSSKIDANTYYVPELGELNPGQVAQIAPDVVAKASTGDAQPELFSTNLVRAATNIPAPLCERLVRTPRGSLLVQEYIPGRTVHELWPTLGWWQRFRILITLRYYIYELRSMRTRIGAPTFPGPPSGENMPQQCTGRLFTSEGSGPFQSYRELARWYQNRLLVMQTFRKEGLQCLPFDDTGPLVFTHMDLHPRNLILGDDGQLWVIDWEHAGWYPPWFEAASMQLFVKSHPDTASSWANCISFIAGSCERPGQLPFIRAIAYSLEILHANIVNLVRSLYAPTNAIVTHAILKIDVKET